MDSELDGRGRGRTLDSSDRHRARRALVRSAVVKNGEEQSLLEVSNLLFATGVKEVSFLTPLFVLPLLSRRPPPRPPAGHALSHAGILSVCGSCTFAAGWEEGESPTLARWDGSLGIPTSLLHPSPFTLPSLPRRTAPIGEQTDGRREGGREGGCVSGVGKRGRSLGAN